MNEINVESQSGEVEHEWKELLYTLFYEIKSEILGHKIEIEEEEYQENVRTITIPKLVKYIHDSIQILIIKKIEDTKQKQKEEDEKFYSWKFSDKKKKYIEFPHDEKKLYENSIRYLENKERILVRNYFQDQLRSDAMENKLCEYIEMENEFEEMKGKLKYEGGRFLENDRKDNEIIIIRNENSNLKKIIKKLEEQIKRSDEMIQTKDKLIINLKEEIKNLEKNKNKLEIKNNINNSIKEQLNLLNGININIQNGTSHKNNIKNKSNKHSNNNSMHSSIYSNRHTGYINDENSSISTRERLNITDRIKVINSKMKNMQFSKKKKIKKKDKKKDLLSTTRNESFEKIRDDFLKKYFSGNRTIKSSKNFNNNKIKISHLPINGNNKINIINSSAYIPLFNNKRNLNNLGSMKRMLGVGSIQSSRSFSTKKKRFSHNNGINYKSMS